MHTTKHPLLVSFYIFHYFVDIPRNLYLDVGFVSTTFYTFYFSVVCGYVIGRTVNVYTYL